MTRKKQEAKTSIAAYIVFGLFSLITLAAGIPKIILAEDAVNMLAGFHYSPVAAQLIGIIWILCAIAVWFKQLRSYAALAATYILAGFVATHIATATPLNWMMAAYGVIPVAVLYFDGFFCRVSPGLEEDAKQFAQDLANEE